MKKMKLFALGLIGASMMMTSCADDEEDPAVGPSLTVTEENSAAGVIDGKVAIEPGDSLHFEWTARDGDARLQTLVIEINGVKAGGLITDNGNELDDNIKSSDNETYQDGVVLPGNAGVYTFTVTDKDGETDVVEIEVEIASDDLSAEQSFQWKRVGSNDGTGLGQFGLAWKDNSSTAAIVTKDGATIFVELSTSAWNNITTKTDLVAAINDATPMSKFEGISSTASNSNLNIVLATLVGGEAYILKLNTSDVASGSAGTTITVDGMYKM